LRPGISSSDQLRRLAGSTKIAAQNGWINTAMPATSSHQRLIGLDKNDSKNAGGDQHQ
jgi:hypothetical protein